MEDPGPVKRDAPADEVCTAVRALVYLTVEWSVPERIARRAFGDAAKILSEEQPPLGIAFYSLAEEARAVRDFLISLNLPVKQPLGCGSVVWLEAGRVVGHEIAGHLLGAAGIVARTLALWGG